MLCDMLQKDTQTSVIPPTFSELWSQNKPKYGRFIDYRFTLAVECVACLPAENCSQSNPINDFLKANSDIFME